MKYVRVIRYEVEVDVEKLEEEFEEKFSIEDVFDYYSDLSNEDLDYEGADIDIVKDCLVD